MHITSRARAALTALSLALAVIAVAGSTPARADIPTVSPGDRIEYLSAAADVTMFCTVGYVYTGRDLHTYAVTAGHCRGKTAGYARATRTGLTGDFTRPIVEPPYQGGPDYGLIDFGIRSLPLRWPTSATPPPPTVTRNPKKVSKSVAPESRAANTAERSPDTLAKTNTSPPGCQRAFPATPVAPSGSPPRPDPPKSSVSGSAKKPPPTAKNTAASPPWPTDCNC